MRALVYVLIPWLQGILCGIRLAALLELSLLSLETAFGNLVSRMQGIGDKNVRYCTRTDRLLELKVFDRFSIMTPQEHCGLAHP